MSLADFYSECRRAILDCAADGAVYPLARLRELVAKRMQLSEEELTAVMPDGNRSAYAYRANWAVTFLKQAGLLTYPKRAMVQITPEGQRVARETTGPVTKDFLRQYPSFCDFLKRSRSKASNPQESVAPAAEETESTLSPLERMKEAHHELNVSLADDLMDEIMRMNPYEFERLVVKLVVAMGYGDEETNGAVVTRKSGDEGIDGMIKADRLGFDAIYTQAKRWAPGSTIGRPELQKFLGALAGQGATKGLFITTGRFTAEAKDFVQKQLHHKIILIDGEKLCRLMIEYGLGVSVEQSFVVKRIDSDFFSE